MNMNADIEYTCSFESDLSSSYLVLRLDGEARLLNHQMEIICQNPIVAFVPFHLRRENDNTSLYYNITSKISLSQYLQRKRLNKKEFLELLRNITKNLMQYSNYLLDLSGFVIHPDYIYINPATAEVSLLYMPVPRDRNPLEDYRKLVKDISVNSTTIDDNANDNYLQRVLNFLRLDPFSLNEFSWFIADLRDSSSVCPNENKTQGFTQMPVDTKAAGDNLPAGKSNENRRYVGIVINSNLIRIILVQALFILAAAIACLIFLPKSMEDISSLAGILLILAAIDTLTVKSLCQKPDGSKVECAGGHKAAGSIKSLSSYKEVRKNTVKSSSEQKPGGLGYNRGLHLYEAAKECDTIMISDCEQKSGPYLERVGAHSGERIMLNKDKFIIGRLQSMVDYALQEGTVGKLHAEITARAGVYYIRDMNSKNGTYVNNIRIPSNKEFEIKKNDRIKLSDYEYIFRYKEGAEL